MPAQLAPSPHNTATDDQMSLAKWKASVARAGEPVRMATARSFRDRQKSTAIELSTTATGHTEWRNSTELCAIRWIASQMIHALDAAIRITSPNEEMFSTLPCP